MAFHHTSIPMPQVPNGYRCRHPGPEDLDAVLDLAEQTGGGMTNFPPDAEILKRRLTASEGLAQVLARREGADEALAEGLALDEPLFFVMEHEASRTLHGIAGLVPEAGGEAGFVCLERLVDGAGRDVLQPSWALSGHAELTSLFVAKDGRGQGLGRFLLDVRLAVFGRHPDVFGGTIFTEFRGWVGPEGEKPFWDEHLKPRAGLDYFEADLERGRKGARFTAGLLPHEPFVVKTFSPNVQTALGAVHDNTRPAYLNALKAGFTEGRFFDAFDLGPIAVWEGSVTATSQRT